MEMANSEQYLHNLIDADDLRQNVLKIILKDKNVSVSPPVFELRLSLFLRAANNYFSTNNEASLEPFPSCFYDPVKKSRLYDDLKKHILNIPKLSDFTKFTSLPVLTWRLLDWIFTNPLHIIAISMSDVSQVLTEDLREKTKLESIPYPSSYITLFEIIPPIPKKPFRDAKSKFGSFYAYHGSPAHNFHSIIHRGLITALNVRKAYGHGTYLTQDLETAKSYTRNHTANLFGGNLQSLAGRRYCVAIVEVVNDPSIKVVDINTKVKYYIVENDELMQLRNLLVFG